MRIFKRGLAALLALLMLMMAFPTGVLAVEYIRTVELTLDEPNSFWAGGSTPEDASFTPSESGVYTFRSLHYLGADFTLCDSDGNVIAEDDPFNRSFFITWYLESGETYYLRADWGDEYTNGQIDLVVSRCPIEVIEFHDLKIVEGYNCSETSYNDPITGEYVTYRLYDYLPTYTAELSDGRTVDGSGEVLEIDGIEYYISYADDQQNHVNTWERGEHTVEASFFGMSDAFIVEIVDCPVVSVDTESTDRIEWVTGYSCFDTIEDPETGEQVDTDEYFVYDSEPDKYIITMEDGEVIEVPGYNPWFDWYGVSYQIETTSDGQSYNNQWSLGANTVSATVMGFDFDYAINVVETPIESVVVYDVDVIEGIDGYWDNTWVTDPETGEWVEEKYFVYSAEPKRYTITLKDGTVYEDTGFWYGDNWYWLQLVGGQSYDNQWESGNSYRQDVEIMGYPAHYTVHVVDTPVASIEMEETELIENVDGYQNYGWYYDEERGEEVEYSYFHYDFSLPNYTITLKDGTVIENDGFYYGGQWRSLEYSDPQHSQNVWTRGRYEVPITIAGYTYNHVVNVVENPIESITVNDVPTNVENLTGYMLYEWIYDEETGEEVQGRGYWYYDNTTPQSFTVRFKNGETIEVFDYFEYNGKTHWLNIDDSGQSVDNPWGVGMHTMTGSLMGVPFTYDVEVLENPVASVVVEPVKLIEGADGYETSDNYYDAEADEWKDSEPYIYYNNIHPQSYVVTLKDGTVIENNGFEWNGQWFSLDINNPQSCHNPWGVGEHTVTGTLAGFEFTYTVIVGESPIDRIEFHNTPIQLLHGVDSSLTYDNLYDENDIYIGPSEEYTWYTIPTDRLYFTVYLNNGEMIGVDGDSGFYFEGEWYSLDIDTKQSYYNQWGLGAHTATVKVLGYTTTLDVEVVETPIASVVIEPYSVIERSSGEWITDTYFDDETGEWVETDEYFRYWIEWGDCVITLKDGTVIEDDEFEWNGTVYGLSCTDLQSFTNQWGVGEHEVPMSIAGYEFTYLFEVIENPIASIEIDKVVCIQNEDGYMTWDSVYDSDLGEYVDTPEYFVYNMEPQEWTITLQDGTVIENEAFVWEDEHHTPGYNNPQSYNNQWGVGTYTVSGSMFGYEYTYEVEVIESPIASIEIDPVTVIEHTRGSESEYGHWDEERGEWVVDGTYYRYDSPAVSGCVITLKDGTVIEDDEFEWNGRNYSVWFDELEQSYENPLTCGTYTLTGQVAGYTFSMDFTIVESPVASVVVKPMMALQNVNGYWTEEHIWNDDLYEWEISPQYFYYYCYPREYTITLKDGTTFTNESVEWNGETFELSTYSEQGYANRWDVGTHTVRGDVAGFEFTFEVEVVDSIVDRVEVDDIYHQKGGGAWTTDWIWSEEMGGYIETPEYCAYRTRMNEMRVFLKDGSVITTSHGFDWNGEWFPLSLNEPEQDYYNQLTTGVYEVTGSIAGYDFSYNVHIKEPQSNGEYEYLVTGDGVIITNCFISPETLTIPSMIDEMPVIGVNFLGGDHGATKALIFPDSVRTIEPYAFGEFSNLESVSFGSGVTNLTPSMFDYADKLMSITVSEDNEYFCILNGALCNAAKDTFIAYPAAKGGIFVLPKTILHFDALRYSSIYKDLSILVEDGHPDYVTVGLVTYTKDMTTVVFAAKSLTGAYTMPDSVTDIESQAFYDVDGLTAATVAPNVTTITYAAFANCSNLQSISMPDGLVSIDGRAFFNDSSLTSVTLPDSLECIQQEAFAYSGLTSVTLPNSVIELGYRAFYGSASLKSINVSPALEFIGYNAFDETAWYAAQDDGVVYLEHIAYGWKGEMDENTTVTIQPGTTVLASGAFAGRENLTKVYLPEGLKTINQDAFAFTGLTSLIIPTTVTYIDYWAFGESKLKTLYFYDEEQCQMFAEIFEDIDCRVIDVEITKQPKDVAAVADDKVKISIDAVGTNLTYQWQYRTSADGEWKDSASTGCNTDTLTVTATAKRHGYQYRCVVTSNGLDIVSEASTLSVLSITEQPAELATAKDDETVKVSVKAAGDGLKYQWYYKDTDDSKFAKSSVTSKTYSLTMNESRAGRQVYCVVTDEHGNKIQSSKATLGMEVSITTQPKTAYAKNDESIKVTVKAIGDGLKYQWYYKDTDDSKFAKLSSETGKTYSTTMTESRAGRQVYCVVTDKYDNEVKSKTVTLTMEASIKTQPKTTYTKNGSTAKVTVKALGNGLKYTWYYKDAGASKYKKASTTSSTYSVKMSSSVKDRSVYCVVTDKYDNEVKSKTVTLRMAASITTQPKTTYTKNGSTAKVTVKAAGDGLKYTWYYKNAGSSKFKKASTTSSTYSVKMSSSVKNRSVYCVVTDKYGKTVGSDTVTLRMAASITTQPKTTTVAKGKTAKVTVKAAGDGLKYTWYYKNAGSSKYKKASTTSSTYSVKMSSSVKNRSVYCVVTDKYGKTVKSKTAVLKMK